MILYDYVMKLENLGIIISIFLILTLSGCMGTPVDSDGDGWTDEQEVKAGTDKNLRDTDVDGIWDPKDENPLDKNIPNKQTVTTVVSRPTPNPTRQVVNATSTYTVEPVVVATPTGNNTLLYVKDFRFYPMNVQINPGDKGIWINKDDEKYKIVELNNKIANISLDYLGTASYIFNSSGSYKFGLYITDYMEQTDFCTSSNRCISTTIQNIEVIP